jgi:hypothetical protein
MRKQPDSILRVILVFCLASNSVFAGFHKSSSELPTSVKLLLDDLNKIIEKVNAIDPNKDTYMVNASEAEWLLKAVSMKDREKWSKDFFKPGLSGKEEFYKRLDVLSAACTKKITSFIPDPSNFVNHNEAHEGLMKKALPNIADMTIHQIGLAQSEWIVQKDGKGNPVKRYVVGYVWAKNRSDDFFYCRVYQIDVVQDYVGNGKFSGSRADLLGSWIVGCR